MQKYENAPKEITDQMMNSLLDNLELGSKTLFSTTYTENGKPMIFWEKNAQALTELTALTDIDLKICKLLLRRQIVRRATKKSWLSGVKEFINLLPLRLTSLFIQVSKKQAQKQVSTEITSHQSLMEKEPKLADTTGTSEVIGNIYENGDLLESDKK